MAVTTCFFVAVHLNSATATRSSRVTNFLSLQDDLIHENIAQSSARIQQQIANDLFNRPQEYLKALSVNPQKCRLVIDQKECEEEEGCTWVDGTGCRSVENAKAKVGQEIKNEVRKEIEEELKDEMKRKIRRDAEENAKEKVRERIQSREDEISEEVSKDVEEELESEERQEKKEKLTPYAEDAMSMAAWNTTLVFIIGILLIFLSVLLYYYWKSRQHVAEEDEGVSQSEDFRRPSHEPEAAQLAADESDPLSPFFKNPFNVLFPLVPLGIWVSYQAWSAWWVFGVNMLAMIPSLSMLSVAADKMGRHFKGQMRVWVSCFCSDLPVLIWIIQLLMVCVTVRNVPPFVIWSVAKGHLMTSTLGRMLLLLGVIFLSAGGRQQGNFLLRYVNFKVSSVLMQAHVLMVGAFGIAFVSTFRDVQDVSNWRMARLSVALAVFIVANGAVFFAWQGTSQKHGLLDGMQEFRLHTTGVYALFFLLACALLVISTMCFIGSFHSLLQVQNVFWNNFSFIGDMWSFFGCFAHCHLVSWARQGEINDAMNAALTSAIHIFIWYLPIATMIITFLALPGIDNTGLSQPPLFSGALMGCAFITFAVILGGRADWLRGGLFLGVYVSWFVVALIEPDYYSQ